MGIVIHMSCDLFKYLLFKQFSLTLSFLSICNNFWFSTDRQLQNQVSDETLGTGVVIPSDFSFF